MCPIGSYHCYLFKNTIDGTNQLNSTRMCVDVNGQVLARDERTGLSPHPNFHNSAHADVTGNLISSGVNLSPEEERILTQRIQHETNQAVAQANQAVQQAQQSLDATLESVSTMLRNMFG